VTKLLAAPTLSVLLLQGACATGATGSMPTEAPVEVNRTATSGQASATRTRTERLEVMAVDPVKRTISLKQPTGEVETMSVGKQVERLDEVKVGDVLVAQYDEGLMLQYQPPNTRAIEDHAIAATPHAEAGAISGVGGATARQGTVLVVSIDYVSRLVIFELANGDRQWVKAGKDIDLQRLKAGDRLVATYVQSMVVKLEKK
jgi:hypothetical protein